MGTAWLGSGTASQANGATPSQTLLQEKLPMVGCLDVLRPQLGERDERQQVKSESFLSDFKTETRFDYDLLVQVVVLLLLTSW